MILVLLLSAVLVVLNVVTHGILLQLIARRLVKYKWNFRFWRIGVLMCLAIVAHLAEIILFQLGYLLLVRGGQFGQIVGGSGNAFSDLFYFSAVTYTSTGYGDLLPTGDLRVLATIEALTGLIMIAWTTSFAFVLMQRYWMETLVVESAREEVALEEREQNLED